MLPNRHIRLISFGYLHGPPPEADLTVDVRRYLRDPAAAAGLLAFDGRHPDVRRAVLDTPGTLTTADVVAQFAIWFPTPQCVIAVGCAGGRHRSVALVEVLAESLAVALDVSVEHRHVHLPRVTQ